MSPIVTVSVVTPKPGQFDAFLEIQLAQMQRVRGQVAGLRGSRLYRSRDGRDAIVLSVFETLEDRERFAASSELEDHLARVRPLVEPRSPGLYDLAYAFGEV